MSITFIPPPAANTFPERGQHQQCVPPSPAQARPLASQADSQIERDLIYQPVPLPNQTQLSNLWSFSVPPPYALPLDPMQALLISPVLYFFFYNTLGRQGTAVNVPLYSSGGLAVGRTLRDICH